MVRILQSPITVLTVSCLLFFGTLFLSLRSLPLGSVNPAARPAVLAEDDPSWKFRNPELDQWVSQIKSEHDALAVREQELKQWEARLAAESRELATVTQAVTHTQEEFDKRVLLFTGQQKDNVKKQLKVIADMSPEGAMALLNEKPDEEAAQILYSLKPDVSGAILDAMSKAGGASARHAATLTDLIKVIQPTPATNNPIPNASR